MSSVDPSKTKIVYDQAYYVESQSKAVGPIAIRPTILDTQNRIFWGDTTSRGFDRKFTKITQDSSETESPGTIVIETAQGTFTLKKLTKTIYDSCIKKDVIGSPTFNSDEELQKYYLNTNFDKMY